MRSKIPMFFLLILVISCNITEDYFETIHDAKQELFNQEGIKNSNIIDEFAFDDGYIIIFEHIGQGETGYAFAYYTNKDDSTVEYMGVSSKISIDKTGDSRMVGVGLEIKGDKEVFLSVGEYNEHTFNKVSKNIKKGLIEIDAERNIYYVVDVEYCGFTE